MDVCDCVAGHLDFVACYPLTFVGRILRCYVDLNEMAPAVVVVVVEQNFVGRLNLAVDIANELVKLDL